MKNEEKAKEIAYNDTLYGEDSDNNSKTDECYIAAIAMAEWKDERVKSCFIFISKLIKDGVLTKDNPEHIMVEQMIELYNNIK